MSSTPHYKGVITQVDSNANNVIDVKPTALDIVWGQDPRYWRITDGGAELLQVCWLEVSGSVPLKRLVKGMDYKVSFKVEMKPDAFGWADSPVYLMVKSGKGRYIWQNSYLSQKTADQTVIPSGSLKIPTDRVLKFTVPKVVSDDDKLQFGMYEIWRGRWKGGMIIRGVVIEPYN